MTVPVQIFSDISALPRFIYQPEGQQFVRSPDSASCLPSGHRRGEMYRERFQLVQHLLLKGENFVRVENFGSTTHSQSGGGTENFSLPRISLSESSDIARSETLGLLVQPPLKQLSLFEISEGLKYPLTAVESLPGSKGVSFTLGYLIQPEAEKFALEGLTLSVNLDLTQAEFSDDMMTLHALVLVKGKMEGNIYRVREVALPPVPRRELFEAEIVAPTKKEVVPRNRSILARAKGDMSTTQETEDAGGESGLAVVFSDCDLEKSAVFERLANVFKGFASVSQAADVIVLMGSFVGSPVGTSTEELRRYQRVFSNLGDFLAKHVDVLRQTELVLIPGPMDPGQDKLLPRFPIDQIRSFDIVARAKTLGVKVTLATNPCRVRLGRGSRVRDLIFFREDLTEVLELNRIKANSEVDFDLTAQVVVSQLHLYPLPTVGKKTKAVLWDFDSALRLHPIPHVLVIGESRGAGLELTVNGCHVGRAPNFAETGEFLVYYGDKLELSQAF